MITNRDIDTLSLKELERRIYAMADDAGAFSIPQVRKILSKMLDDGGTPIAKEVSEIKEDIRIIEDDLADVRRRLKTITKE